MNLDTAAGDGAIDVKIEGVLNTESLLVDGKNFFQITTGKSYKPWQMSSLKQELIGEPRSKPCKELLGKALQACLDEHGRYVFVAFGQDMTPLQQSTARQNLTELFRACGYENPAVKVIGQGQLIGLFSGYPSLSFELFDGAEFTVQTVEGWKANQDMTLSLQKAETQKRFIENIRSTVRSGEFRHIHVIGEPGIGKTRLLLEAMSAEDLSPASMYIPHAEDFLKSPMFEDLVQPDQHYFTHLVIDDCEEKDRDFIWNAIKVKPDITLITVDHGPGTVSGGSMKIFECPLLPDKQIEKIIGGYLTDRKEISHWVKWCGGSPRVAHTVGDCLRRKPNDILKPPAAVPIWDRFILGHKTKETMDAEQHVLVLRHIALFQRFGFEAPVDDEAKFICGLVRKVDHSITWTKFQSIVRHYKERRILHGKKILYIAPKALHAHLWLGFWEYYGTEFNFQAFFSHVPPQLKKWFMGQFIYAHASPGAGQIIKEILTPPKGPFADQAFLVSEAGTCFLNYLAVADPASTLTLLEATFGDRLEDKLRSWDAGRQDIVGMLEKIAVRKDLFSRAARMLVRISFARNGHDENIAKETLQILFMIGLGWAPTEATPEQRFAVIQGLLRGKDNAEKELGVALCRQWLGTCGGTCSLGAERQSLRPTAEFWKQKTVSIAGKEKMVLMPTVEFWRPKTYGEYYDCYRMAWRFLWEETRTWQEPERRRANTVLMESASGMLRFSTLADQVVATLFEIAGDPATGRTELTARVLDLQQAKLPQSVTAKLKSLERTLTLKSFLDRLSVYGQRLLAVVKYCLGKERLRRILSLTRTFRSYLSTKRKKIEHGYEKLTIGLHEMSSLNLEQFDETPVTGQQSEKIVLKHLGTARRQIDMPVPQMKTVKHVERIKRQAVN